MHNDDRPATIAQLHAIGRRADLIEREVAPNPGLTRGQARKQIADLDARIADLRADGIID